MRPYVPLHFEARRSCDLGAVGGSGEVSSKTSMSVRFVKFLVKLKASWRTGMLWGLGPLWF